jgi:hypothetical protein
MTVLITARENVCQLDSLGRIGGVGSIGSTIAQ